MENPTVLDRIEKWLLFNGFEYTPFQTLKRFYFHDDDRDPDILRGANLIVLGEVDQVSSPVQMKLRSDEYFQACLQFFQKQKKRICLATNFTTFLVFPTTTATQDLIKQVITTRPASTSFVGSQFPIVMDLSSNQVHFFNPSYSRQALSENKLADQIEFLFHVPLNPPLEISDGITHLVNLLRRSVDQRRKPSALTKSLQLSEIKWNTRQLYYDGTMRRETDSARKLLYAWYLTEMVNWIKDNTQFTNKGVSDFINWKSFLSLEQFVIDNAEGFGRIMLGSFQQGFDQSQRSITMTKLKKELIKNREIVSYAYCNSCQKVVQLSGEGRCLKGGFHKTNLPTLFEVNEQEAIQAFIMQGGK